MATSFLVCFTMNSRAIAILIPFRGLSLTSGSVMTLLAYGSLGMMPLGSAVYSSSGVKPFIASSTRDASLMVLQWMPARSPGFLPVMPPFMMTPLVVMSRAILFLEAGPWHEAVPCSQIEHVTMLAATETPEPLLVPRGTRAVSYGLHA